MARKKKVENAGTYAAKKRSGNADSGPMRGASSSWNSSGNQAMWKNKPTPGPGFGPERGNPSAVTSASGTPGPPGVLTTGHYSSNGQRMFGGIWPGAGQGRPRGLDTPDAQANRRARKQLPGAR
jgi:hypothetical protein